MVYEQQTYGCFVARLGTNTIPLRPIIQVQPQSVSVTPGAPAFFGVSATGAAPLAYQWRFNGTDIPAATNSAFEISTALLANQGNYDVVITNAAGSVTSEPALLTLVAGAPSFSDSFAGRGILLDVEQSVTGSNLADTEEPGEPSHAGRKGSHSAWLTWTAPDNGLCTVDTLDSSFDTVLAVYTGSSVNALTEVGSNDDISKSVLQSRVSFSALAGVPYQFAVDGYGPDDVGNIHFHLSFSNGAPAILVQPVSQSVLAGANATFTVTAVGQPLLRYQWRFNGNPISAATSPSYALLSVDPSRAGDYSVVVVNDHGSVTSQVARLTVLEPPRFVTTPADRSVLVGDRVVFSATVAGTAPIAYQWLSNGTNLPGATDPTLVIDPVTASRAGTYALRLSNAYGTTSSPPATLKVSVSLSLEVTGTGLIAVNPSLTRFDPGAKATLTAIPGAGAFFERWDGDLQSTNNPLTLTLNTNVHLIARFSSIFLDLRNVGSGSIQVSPVRPAYALGDNLTLTAVPGRWHRFDHWADGPALNPRTITVSATNIYTAWFTPTQALEVVRVGEVSRLAPVGMPAVIVDGLLVTNDTVSALALAEVELRSTFPDAVLLYSLDGSEPGLGSLLYHGPFHLGRTAVVRAAAFTGDLAGRVEADPVEVRVVGADSLDTRTEGGGHVVAVPGGSLVPRGSTVQLTAVPDAGWEFLDWFGDASGGQNPWEIAMTESRAVEARFVTSFDALVTEGGGVEMSPPGGRFPFGTPLVLTAIPDPGYVFTLWGAGYNTALNPLFTVVTTAQVRVPAVFLPLGQGEVSLVTRVEGAGRVVRKPAANRFTTGQVVVLTAVADPGELFVGWSPEGLGSDNPLRLPLTASQVVTARFTRHPRIVFATDPSVDRDGRLPLIVEGEWSADYAVEAASHPDGPWSHYRDLRTRYGRAQFDWSPGSDSAPQFLRVVQP